MIRIYSEDVEQHNKLHNNNYTIWHYKIQKKEHHYHGDFYESTRSLFKSHNNSEYGYYKNGIGTDKLKMLMHKTASYDGFKDNAQY